MSPILGLCDFMARGDALQSDSFLEALWQEAPFTRLPPDAPVEMQDYVEDLRDPRRSYAVHRASRRHDFQNLVSRFMIQLRTGCGDRACDTSSCFTCRARLAGIKPIRRYSPTSARILAVYMAGCDNPYDSLCPGLRPGYSEPHDAGARLEQPASLPFVPWNKAKPATASQVGRDALEQSSNNLKIELHRKTEICPEDRDHAPGAIGKSVTYFTVSDQPVSKDHRSFTAAVFETTAFKMVQWLTPGGINGLRAAFSRLLSQQQESAVAKENNRNDTSVPQLEVPSSNSLQLSTNSSQVGTSTGLLMHELHTAGDSVTIEKRWAEKLDDDAALPEEPHSFTKTGRRRSTGSLMFSTSLEGGRSVKLGCYDVAEEIQHAAVRGQLTSLSRPGVQSAPEVPRHSVEPDRKDDSVKLEGSGPPLAGTDGKSMPERKCAAKASMDIRPQSSTAIGNNNIVENGLRCPQSLKSLTPNLVELLCDIYSEDGTAEHRNGFSSDAEHYGPANWGTDGKLMRPPTSRPSCYSLDWKLFNDQAIFNVLSNPRALLSSFTINGKLLDSQTLWYCMVRLTRATPSLVFHSLWLAAEDLLVAPQDIRRDQRDELTEKRKRRRLSQSEAGSLIAICFHALVAAVPVVSDSRTLYEMSRIRSGGQTRSNGSTNDVLSLEYDEAFSNDLCLRLARRLFLSIAAWRRYSELQKRRGHTLMPGSQNRLLEPLLTQLDFMNNEACPALEFRPADRLLHETRVPTLLLDWARAVLMSSWDGQPYFPEDNAFGGAMAFISSMYQRRNSLLLGDIQFRVDYFSEYLNTVEVPVAWSSPPSLLGVGHMLDYPFLFTSDTLVSYFRSINFARMSKTYEESSSLQTRMNAIVQPGSLITNPHHKFVLQDLLRTASAKYLILEIGRKNVVRDAFDQLWRREQRELLRPLKVHLGEDGGEEGFDSGGVQQEFFRMAISEIMDPIFGAFSVDERTRMAWFVPGSVVETWSFELMGVLVSLALYNGLTLPVTFPRALYRKLLGAPVTELHHIADGWPDLVSGFTALLEWDESNGPVEDVFARTYDFSVSTLGSYISRDMKKADGVWPSSVMSPAGDCLETPAVEGPLVTSANRDEYVSDYIRYLTDVSIRPQFEAFEKGFHRCLSSRSLKLLSPSILQSLVEGIQDIDILELRMNTRYVGWDASHRTVKEFWSVVKKYDLDMRRRLLEFVTASDRVPVGGMRNMQFVIQKNGREEGHRGRLPTAYTCYGTLLLPEYKNKEVLRERLGMALENAQGFGFA